MAESSASGQLKRQHYRPFGLPVDAYNSPNEQGYTGHVHDDTGLVYMQARYYDPVIGRFYSNDPVGWVADNPVHSFGRYTYVLNNPYKYVDPDGMYGRGAGWTDKQWKEFDKAQRSAAKSMAKTSSTLKKQAGGMKEGDTTKEGYSASDLNNMAASLDAGVAALNDNGTGGHFANAESWENSTTAGTGEVGGKIITMNVAHPSFGDNQQTRFTVGHESLHNAGLSHPAYMGQTPYRYGSFGQRQSYKNLPGPKRVTNPDYVMSQVYP